MRALLPCRDKPAVSVVRSCSLLTCRFLSEPSPGYGHERLLPQGRGGVQRSPLRLVDLCGRAIDSVQEHGGVSWAALLMKASWVSDVVLKTGTADRC